jgi:hypothetical protein
VCGGECRSDGRGGEGTAGGMDVLAMVVGEE